MHGHILYSYQEDMVTVGIMFAVMPLCVPVYEAIHDKVNWNESLHR